MNYYVGIDLGGTNSKIGVVDDNGNIISSVIVKTDSREGMEATIKRLSEIIKTQISSSGIDYENIKGVGIGVPGPVVDQGIVKMFSNFDWPKNANIAQLFSEELKMPIKVENDVNVITLGECWKGSAEGLKNVLGLAIGTGIGAGIVINGELITGKSGSAGEVGHIKIVKDGKLCGCGQSGCWEAYSSAVGLIREANSRLTVNKSNLLYENTKDRDLEAKDIFDAAREGDRFSLDLVEYEAETLAMGIGNLLNVLDFDRIVVGGGVSLAGDILFDKLKEKLPKYALSPTLENLMIVPAKLGNNAGVIGAAKLIRGGN